MLKNKYLKYNPSITFEIFEKVYDKLIGQGWNTSVPKDTLYRQFSGGTWPYIVNTREKEFYSRHNSNNKTEITIQELLGYDPFVSDDLLERWLKETKERSFSLYGLENHISLGATCPYEEVYLKLKGSNPKERAQILYDLWNSELTSLPKKWCIAVNKLMPDFELISEWRKKTSRYDDEYRGTAGYLFEDGAWNNINHLEVPELTMDQFKKWVFKPKEFTLPLKWRVIATSEAEGKLLIPYANELFKSKGWTNSNVQNYWLCISPGKFNSLSKNTDKLSEYEEITFTQFKQYVLKETSTNTEKDWTKVSKEELLAEANKRYPIGTKYRNKPTGSIYTLGSKLTIDPRNNVCDEARQCHVFLCGKWAEIVELAKKDWNERDTQEVLDEAIRRYPIGTIVMSPVVSNDKYTVLKTPAFFKENKRVITDGDKKVTLFDFDKNTWAEIVKETQPEKWSVGTYVVLLKDYGGHPKGTIDKIIRDNGPVTVKVSLPYNGTDYCNLSKASEAKWFATKSEAEAFAKTQFEEPMSTEDDLTGRYLRATVDHPQSTSLKKGDIIKILDQFSLVSYQIEKGWTYTTNNSTSSDFEVLPKDYKPESTSPNLNFQHNEFYRVTLSKYSYIFLFTDAKLEKERIDTIIYYDCCNKKCLENGGFIYLKDITVCERVPFETVKRDYSELYCKIYTQPKSETPSKFEVSKWYSQDASGNAKNFRKCFKVHTDHFEYDECINRGVWKKDSAHTYWDTPHLADMEVVNKIINDHISRTEPKSKLYEGYTVGDYITITREPKLWSSRCNRKNLLTKVSYPFTAKITRIKIDGFDCHIEAGDGGWSLDHMLKNSCVRKATSEEIGNLIHNEMNKLLNIPYKFASEHSVIASKNFDDEIDFIYLSED